MSHPVHLLIRTLATAADRPRRRAGTEPADLERTAESIHELMRMLEWRLSSLGSCVDELDAALANGAFAHPHSPAAVNLARAENALRALANRIAQQRAALIEHAQDACIRIVR